MRDSAEVLQVLDESGVLADRLKMQFESNESDIKVELSSKSEKELTEQVKEGEIDSFLTLALDDTNTIQANYIIDECDGIHSSNDAPRCTPIDSNGNESGRAIIVW